MSKPMIPEDALDLLLRHAAPAGQAEDVPLVKSSGRILAETLTAGLAVPHFRRSPLDGYACHAADISGASPENPAVLKVIGEADAGCTRTFHAGVGEALRIMTGAPVPDGCDCVIRQEDTDEGMDTVKIYQALKPGMNVCPAGEDIPEGTLIAEKGTVMDASLIGALATQGMETVRVFRPVHVLLLQTGDELLAPGEKPAYGKVYDSNGPVLTARIQELGAEVTHHITSLDDPVHAAHLIRESLSSVDLIISTGGVSVGKKDIMHQVLPELSATRLFWRIAMKPGSPLLCAEVSGRLMICLSGNPFAARVGFELFAKPVIARLSGSTAPVNPGFDAVLMNDFPKSSPQRRMIQGRYAAGTVHVTDGSTTNGSTLGMVGCNCLIDIPAGSPALKAGEQVRVLML